MEMDDIENNGGAANEKGGISRRKLLKLAAYSVPTMSLVNMAASTRALATSPGSCFWPCRLAQIDTGSGYAVIDCETDQPVAARDIVVGQCYKFMSTTEGLRYHLEDCATGAPWPVVENECYRMEQCTIEGQYDCWQPRGCYT